MKVRSQRATLQALTLVVRIVKWFLFTRTSAAAGVLGSFLGMWAVAAMVTAGASRPPTQPTAKRAAQRERMVVEQIEEAADHRDAVADPAVLRAMRSVPRHVFVPDEYRDRAYDDTPLPIGYGQTISQPYIVASMTELLELGPESRVLEIGTGSGYQAAVLAEITSQVYTVEIIGPLARRAEKTLGENGYDTVECRNADGYFGWVEQAPFDAIIVTCAAGHLPPPLWEQLTPGGRIVIPIGGTFSVQRLVVVEKDKEGRRSSYTVMGVRFVPMTGHALDMIE
jgi:protein-L-isoaspartate(D-aspartate) O-methyltransferase